MDIQRTGILLLNTGSPNAPETAALRTYLAKFLNDPYVIDIPAWKRWLLVNGIILRFRPKKSAAAYRKVWMDEGAPLTVYSKAFQEALKHNLNRVPVELGMAYGDPSIEAGIESLIENHVSRIIAVPMFPHYAAATWGAVMHNVYKIAADRWNVPSISVLPPFYQEKGYLEALSAVSRPVLDKFKPDHVLFSYHGLPERHIKKSDPSGMVCLEDGECCEKNKNAHPWCYKHQVLETTKGVVQRLGLKKEYYSVSFQSRLGRDKWLEPATVKVLAELPKQGVKRLAVLTPSFVADGLESLEEIGIGGKEVFLENGGAAFELVPCLNAHHAWVEAFAHMLEPVLRMK